MQALDAGLARHEFDGARGPAGSHACAQRRQNGLQIAPRGGSGGLPQCRHLTLHLKRRIHHHPDVRKGLRERVLDRRTPGLQRRLLFPGPGIQTDQIGQQQQRSAPPRRSPGGRLPQLAAHAGQTFDRARAARGGQLKLRQVPGRTGGLQPALGPGHHADLALKHLLGQRGHAGFGQGLQPLIGLTGDRNQGQRRGRQGKQHDAPHNIAGHQQLRQVGLTHSVQVQRAGRRGKLRHDAGDRTLREFQRLQVPAQPVLVTNSDPGLSTGNGTRRQGQMQLLRLIQQPVFEQAFQDGAQPRRTHANAPGQLDQMPGQRHRRDDRNHLAAPFRRGYQGQGHAGVVRRGSALGRAHVVIARRGTGCHQG